MLLRRYSSESVLSGDELMFFGSLYTSISSCKKWVGSRISSDPHHKIAQGCEMDGTDPLRSECFAQDACTLTRLSIKLGKNARPRGPVFLAGFKIRVRNALEHRPSLCGARQKKIVRRVREWCLPRSSRFGRVAEGARC